MYSVVPTSTIDLAISSGNDIVIGGEERDTIISNHDTEHGDNELSDDDIVFGDHTDTDLGYFI